MTTEPNNRAEQPDLTKMVEAGLAEYAITIDGKRRYDERLLLSEKEALFAILLRHLQPLAEQIAAYRRTGEDINSALNKSGSNGITEVEQIEDLTKQLTAAKEELASCRAALGHYFDYFHGNSGGMPEGTSERARKLLNRIHFNK